MKQLLKELNRITNKGEWGNYSIVVGVKSIDIRLESTAKREPTVISWHSPNNGRAERQYLELQLLKEPPFCPHEKISRIDGLDKCMDCGLTNY